MEHPLQNPLRQTIINFIIERPGRKHTVSGWAKELTTSGQELAAKFAAAPDTEFNRRVVSHLTGIEGWGSSRLRVFLGDPLVQDEYDGYRPAKDLDWPAMQAAFTATRQETLAVVTQLAAANPDASRKVLHNQMGPLTAQGWLRYLHMHSTWEAKKLRG